MIMEILTCKLCTNLAMVMKDGSERSFSSLRMNFADIERGSMKVPNSITVHRAQGKGLLTIDWLSRK